MVAPILCKIFFYFNYSDTNSDKLVLNTFNYFNKPINTQQVIYCQLKLLFLLFKNQVQEPYLAVKKSGFLVNPKTGQGFNQDHSSIVGSKPLSHSCGRNSDIASAFRAVLA